jgi:hypothetical protein
VDFLLCRPRVREMWIALSSFTFELEKDRSRGRLDPQLTRMRYGLSDPNILNVKLKRIMRAQKSLDFIGNEAFPETYFRVDGRRSAQSLARYVLAIEVASAPPRENPVASTKEFQRILSEKRGSAFGICSFN